ncbi:MAG: ROK family protein [Vicinamibacterales bacterium]
MRIGIDLGGTKIEAIALGPDGSTWWRKRVAAPRGEYAATLQAVVSLVSEVERTVRQQGTVGVGMPGTLSPATGLVKNSNSTWLNGQALGTDLPRLLGRPVRFANDANCFALSEAVDGAAAGAHVVFGVILGTGIGGGIVVDRRVMTGANAIAGEWGHNPLPAAQNDERPGPPCYCGRAGCIETFLSGSGLVSDFISKRTTPASSDTVMAIESPRVSAADVSRLAQAGDVDALAALDRHADRLARALASVINVLDPDVIVLGGGLSNIERLYAAVPARWATFVFSDRVDTRLVRAAHGDSSGVRGAAWLWEAS